MRRHANTPSLGQIALEAGVSRAAVSMALRNHPRIPLATRQRIQSIAQKLGWRPNPLLAEAMSAIRAGQPPTERVTLAWITAHPKREAWKRVPFFRRCHEGALARAAAAGYQLEHFWLGDADGHAARLGDILYARGIVGLLIAPLPEPATMDLQWSRFAAAAVAYTLTEPRLHRAADNHCAAARVAVARLHAAGRRRIGLALSSNYDRRVHGLWSAGFFWQTHEEGIADPGLLHRPPELSESAFVSWVRTARPDAIIGTDGRLVGWLRGAGYALPEDVAFACLDLPAADGSVAGIYQDAAGIGACAVDLLAGQLLRHERGVPDKPRTLIVDGRWYEGATAPATLSGEAVLGDAEHLLSNTGDSLPLRPVPFD
jgi:LacI family transcriptional regulator